MGSRGKKKTTFEKLARESRLRERRMEKQARKEDRKRASEVEPTPPVVAFPAGVPPAVSSELRS